MLIIEMIQQVRILLTCPQDNPPHTLNYLILAALRSPTGHVYINDELEQGLPDPTSTYTAGGTTFLYERPFQSIKGESLRADGPTTQPLDLLVSKCHSLVCQIIKSIAPVLLHCR